MNGEEGRNPVVVWIEGHLIPSAFIALGLVVVVGLILANLGGGGAEGPLSLPPPSSDVGDTTTTPKDGGVTDDPNRPELEQLDCATLLTDDDIDAAFFGEDATGPRGYFLFAQGETCLAELDDDSGDYLQIEPGDPSDFAEDATLEGMTAEFVDGVGDGARWFDDGGALGILSVGVAIDEAAVIYRIHVGISDLDAGARLDMATGLALTALPRFPGVTVVEEPEPEVEPLSVVVTPDDVDADDHSYLGHLLAGVQDGEWSLGEGLVVTLTALTEGSELEGNASEEPDNTAGEVIALTRQHLAEDPSGPSSAELTRLIDLLAPGAPRLDAMATEETAAATGLLVSTGDVMAAEENPTGPVDCETYFTASSPCVTRITHPTLEQNWPGKYSLYVPLTGLGSWSAVTRDVVMESLLRSAHSFEALVTEAVEAGVSGAMMPEVRVFLTPFDQPVIHNDYQNGVCTVYVNQPMNDPSWVATYLRMLPSEEIGKCLLQATFSENPRAIDQDSRWWYSGLSRFLSAVVYPQIDLEHGAAAVLQSIELSSRLENRYHTNYPYFAHLNEVVGLARTLGFVGRIPESLSSDFAENWHPYNVVLTDAALRDLGGGYVPYDPDVYTIVLDRSGEVEFEPDPFGLVRASIVVPAGQTACVSYDKTGQGDVTASWRQGDPGISPGLIVLDADWTSDLPDELEDRSVLVVTSIRGNVSLVLTVEKLTDEDCEDEDDSDEQEGSTFGEAGAGATPSDCLEFCDPSAYFWGPMTFTVVGA